LGKIRCIRVFEKLGKLCSFREYRLWLTGLDPARRNGSFQKTDPIDNALSIARGA
jgi:hypothetical protein